MDLAHWQSVKKFYNRLSLSPTRASFWICYCLLHIVSSQCEFLVIFRFFLQSIVIAFRIKDVLVVVLQGVNFLRILIFFFHVCSFHANVKFISV